MIKIDLSERQEPAFPGTLPWYDTKEGIVEAITSLEGLNNLARERHIAGYDRKERLGQFYVLNGRYSTDTCGNFCTVSGIPKDIPFSDIPAVLTYEEFFEFLKERTDKNHSICSSLDGGQLPRTDLFCPHCGKGWDISNCHDVVLWQQHDVVSLADFVGKTLAEVRLVYSQKTDAIYFMQSDILIRHDRFIDLSPKYPNPEREYQKDIVVNERGWVSEREGIDNDYIIQEGDEGFFNVWKYFHGDCNRKNLAIEEERKFREIFEKAGFKDIRMLSLPNGYCPCDHCAPWFNVNTEFGTIQVGWRKRVINIDWTQMYRVLKQCRRLPKKTFASLFEDENVTKGDTSIHAWGWDKAEDYLSRLHNHLV